MLATCHRPRRRGRGGESEEVALERGRVDAVIAGLLFMAGMRRSEVSALRWADVADSTDGDGMLVTVRRSKTNPEGEVNWLRLSPGDVVMELGAGTCWLLHFLNRYGCPTIAVDVSPTALEMGHQLFKRDPLTDWGRDPRFLPYDGHRIPLPDGHVDKIILYDAFHHVPNQDEILREMARVLKTTGVVAMCEPAPEHSHTKESRHEMDAWDVLENDIDVESLESCALACGFSKMTVVPIGLPLSVEVPVGLGIMDGGDPHDDLYKGEYHPTTRNPDNPQARIEPAVDRRRVTVGAPIQLHVRLTNTGDTRWLCGTPDQRGATQLAANLHRIDPDTCIDSKWSRTLLPRDVPPGDHVTLDVVLPTIETPGEYRIEFDVIAEHVCAFAECGSPTADLPITVI